ncbi:hypothetical protein [Pseudidiomarina terrestris]|uniref:hypothetical protein n=1 Tax=Pseudidiomarina terrestris TaxID=2820060 RepID=UPI002651FF7E|nr:hypothetical protein [Pseudidiomarina sp. 1ASP75-5]MDN7135356.1 hypothetical protein [Pseudidiomarina sp. 1ASP75-5]
MARTNAEKQIAFIIAKIELEHPAKYLSQPFGSMELSRERICQYFYPLLGNRRDYDTFKNSFFGQIAGVKKAITGEKNWTDSGLDALGTLHNAGIDDLRHYYSTMAELAQSIH